MGDPELIKVCLVNRGAEAETPWAEDLGPVPGSRGSRKVRLVNVPFLHAKPTYGDVIVVSPVEDGLLTWDRDGVIWAEVSSLIAEDGGRWAMIVDYAPADHVASDAAFRALAKTCEQHGVICERAWSPEADEPGRAYLAVANTIAAAGVMATLTGAGLPLALTQVHPAPQGAAKPRASAKVKAQPKVAAKSTSKPSAKARPKTAAKATAKPSAKSKPQPKAKSQPKSKAKSKSKSKPKAQAKPRRKR